MTWIRFDAWTIGLLTGVMLGLLVMPYLHKLKRLTGYLLEGLILIFFLNLVNYLLVNTGAYHKIPFLVGVFQPLLFLIGPIYLFYIQSILDSTFKIRISYWPHAIPFIVACYYHWDFIFMASVEKIGILDRLSALSSFKPSITMCIYIVCHGMQGLIYVIIAEKKLKEASRLRPGLFSKQEFMSWVGGLNRVMGGFWCVVIGWGAYLSFSDHYFLELDYAVMLILSIIISLPSLGLIYYHRPFNEYLLALYDKKYQKSTLSREQSNSILRKLLELMESEKPYLDSKVKISTLALRLSISPNLLSQVINQELNKNYFEFINEYRISEAIRRLGDPKYSNLSILGIAMEVGFTNKNTFNRLFKKSTGLTPSQFLRSQSI